MGALDGRRLDLLLLILKVSTTTERGERGRERERGSMNTESLPILHVHCSYLYLEDNGGALAVGWVGGASSSKKGLNVYIRDDKIIRIWLASNYWILV